MSPVATRLRAERGMTLVELIIVMAVLAIILGAVSTAFSSGTRAGADVDARISAQTNLGVAVGRLEYEARCAATVGILSSGAGISMSLPSLCLHATGNVSWCVVSGVLTRYAASSCTGTGQAFVTNITSPTPFACVSTVGSLPQVQVALTTNITGRASDAASVTERITMRNAHAVTSGASDCA